MTERKPNFGNQIKMTFIGFYFLYCHFVYSDEMLLLLCQRAIMQPAKEFLSHNNQRTSLCMMGNNVIRAEGKAKFAMMAMIIPLLSILIDILL
jgi:Na+-driven multidrug efflux pump